MQPLKQKIKAEKKELNRGTMFNLSQSTFKLFVRQKSSHTLLCYRHRESFNGTSLHNKNRIGIPTLSCVCSLFVHFNIYQMMIVHCM